MADTYFVSRSAFPTCSNLYKTDAEFGLYFLTDEECGALFSRSRQEKVYNHLTNEHEVVDPRILVNIAPEGEKPQLIVCDPSRKVVSAIVEFENNKIRQQEAAALRKSMLLKAGKRIRTEYDVDIDTREAELTAPAYDPETDPMSDFLVDELLNVDSPLAIAVANA